jgi:hypothetical protein
VNRTPTKLALPQTRRRRVAESKFAPAEKIRAILKLRGITVLAIYRNKPRTTVLSRCDFCGLEWLASWNQLQRPKKSLGCPDCAPNARVTLEDYQKIAHRHGGEVLLMARTTTQESQWKCAKGHLFSRPYNNIQKFRTFCLICSERLSERICRAAAEQLFGGRFKNTPLRGVHGVGGRDLEFDAYCRSLKLAIEHNGPQHYHPVRFGNQTEIEAMDSFRKQEEHDRRRREYCKAQGITLIEVPELGRRTKVEDIKAFIRAECLKADFPLPKGFDQVRLKLDAHYLATTAEEMWDRVLRRVRELGYTLKTKDYPGANRKLSLVCRIGHPYTPRVANFLNGQICRRCYIQHLVVPVVVLPLGPKAERCGDADARVFDSIEECANALGTSPNNVQIVAKGRGNSCKGFGVARITPEQAKRLRRSAEALEQFCRARWPSPETYDPQDWSRKHLIKPVQFSDGREFPSRSAAAKALGVSEAAIYHAVRTGNTCKGHGIRETKSK